MRINQTLKTITLCTIFFTATLSIATAETEVKELTAPLSHSLMSVDEVIYARDLKLKSLNNETIDIKDFKGKSIIVNFWGVSALPTTFIINPRGEIVYGAVGGIEFDHPDIIQSIKALNLYELESLESY